MKKKHAQPLTDPETGIRSPRLSASEGGEEGAKTRAPRLRVPNRRTLGEEDRSGDTQQEQTVYSADTTDIQEPAITEEIGDFGQSAQEQGLQEQDWGSDWEGGLYPDEWQVRADALDYSSGGAAEGASDMDPHSQEAQQLGGQESPEEISWDLETAYESPEEEIQSPAQDGAQDSSFSTSGLSLNALKRARYARAIEKEGKAPRRLWRRRYSRIWKQIWGYGPLTRKLLVLSLLIFVVTVTLLLPPFYAGRIRIVGLHQLQGSRVLEVSGLHTGQHMLSGLGGSLEGWLRLRYTSAEQRILAALPEVQEVQITPTLPGEIQIRIVERIGVAYIHSDDSYLIVDREGVVLSILTEEPKGLPLIEGVSQSTARVGQAIDAGLRRDLSSAVQIIATVLETDLRAGDQWNFLGRVQSIRPLAQDGHLLLVRNDNGSILTVRLGAVSELKDHLFWLRAVLKRQLLSVLPDGMLDLSGAYRMYRPQSAFVVSGSGGETQGKQPILSNPSQSQAEHETAEKEGELESRRSSSDSGNSGNSGSVQPAQTQPAVPRSSQDQEQAAGSSQNSFLPQFPDPLQNESADSVLNP